MADHTLVLECRYNDSHTALKTHFHNAYEILFMTKGKIRISIGSKKYVVEAGSLVFISNFEEHSIEILEVPYERYFVILSPTQMNRVIGDPQLMSVFKSRPYEFCHVFHLPQYAPKIAECLSEIIEEAAEDRQFGQTMTTANLQKILIMAYRGNPEGFPNLNKQMNPGVYEVQKYIDQNFYENLQIRQLAEQFFINPFYLSHCFKELTGYSPKQYLMLSRLSHAKELLLDGDLSVSDIAYRAGFSDTNNFIRLFKRETGITPHQYRVMNTK